MPSVQAAHTVIGRRTIDDDTPLAQSVRANLNVANLTDVMLHWSADLEHEVVLDQLAILWLQARHCLPNNQCQGPEPHGFVSAGAEQSPRRPDRLTAADQPGHSGERSHSTGDNEKITKRSQDLRNTFLALGRLMVVAIPSAGG